MRLFTKISKDILVGSLAGAIILLALDSRGDEMLELQANQGANSSYLGGVVDEIRPVLDGWVNMTDTQALTNCGQDRECADNLLNDATALQSALNLLDRVRNR